MLYDFEATGTVSSREPELKAHQLQTLCRRGILSMEFYGYTYLGNWFFY